MSDTNVSAYGGVSRASAIEGLVERMKRGEVEVLLLYGANPAFFLLASWGFQEALESVPAVI